MDTVALSLVIFTSLCSHALADDGIEDVNGRYHEPIIFEEKEETPLLIIKCMANVYILRAINTRVIYQYDRFNEVIKRLDLSNK